MRRAVCVIVSDLKLPVSCLSVSFLLFSHRFKMSCQCLASISSEEVFKKTVDECNDHLLVFLFTAEWAPHASQLVDALTELMKNQTIGSIKYFKVEAESLPNVSKQYSIQSIPSTLLVAKGKAVTVVEGSDVAAVTKKIREVAFKEFPFTVSQIPSSARDTNDINDRLKALVNRSPVMLFIKGDRDTPRCGFTRQLLQIMQSVNMEFDTFDILSDEEVRQGLKTFSNWPTYPQVYVKGNLIGGLDIVKELQDMGELEDTLRT